MPGAHTTLQQREKGIITLKLISTDQRSAAFVAPWHLWGLKWFELV